MQRINISQEVVFTEALTISTSRATSPGVFLSDTGSGLIPTPVTSIAKDEIYGDGVPIELFIIAPLLLHLLIPKEM